MAFALRNLSVLAYANGFTLWHYKAGSDDAAMNAPGYFAEAGDMLNAGDLLMVTGTQGGRVLCVAADARGPRTLALQS